MKRKILSTLFICIMLLAGTNAWAAPDNLALVHKPILAALLPEPGRATSLEISLPNNKDLSIKVRAEVVIDGVLLDIPMDGSFGDDDRTIYRAVIKAPIHDLAYRFHVQDGQEKSASSDQFRVERLCKFDPTPADTTSIEDLTGVEQARKLSAVSKQLEAENISYNEVLTSIKKIEEMLQ